jgi:hypothetical protein
MAKNRFYQYKAALCLFFRKRGYNVNSKDMTVTVDVEKLTPKEAERLKKLQNWGFTVVNPSVRDSSRRPNYIVIDDYDNDCCNETK